MSIIWNDEGTPTVIMAPGFPPPTHPAEADVFARHVGVPGLDQAALGRCHVLVVGAGGLGSWAAVALARLGVTRLTLMDPDRFDRTNAPRQLMFAEDVGQLKAERLARHVAPHMIAGGTIRAVPRAFEDVSAEILDDIDLALGLVDNNACRLALSQDARQRGVPVVFTMLSLDGQRVHSFLQGPASTDACLWCALPNLDPNRAAPCAAATIVSCLAATTLTMGMALRALGADDVDVQNWCDDDLHGQRHVGRVGRRLDCCMCAAHEAHTR